MKTPKTPNRGKCGNVVTSRNHFGSYQRAHTPARKPATPAQRGTRGDFGFVVRAWGQLTDEQRLAWMTDSRHARTKSRVGEKSTLTGQTYFIRVNCARLAFGLDLLTEPPPQTQPIINPVRRLVIANVAGRVTLKLRLAEPPNGDVMVFGSAPLPATTYRCFKCPRLGPLPSPKSGVCDITSLYVKRHGAPPVGKRVFIRTRPRDAATRDQFLEFIARVPTPQPGNPRTRDA